MLGALLLALALATAPAGASENAGAADLNEPGVVRIDAVPSDVRGRIVENLQIEDFEVLDAGAPRPIENVRFVRPGQSDPAETAAPIESRADERTAAELDGARLFAVFLDEYHITAGASADRARQALVQFVNEALGPRDLVVVVKPLDSLLTLRLTRDHKNLLPIIESLQGRNGQYEARNAFEQELIAGTPQRIEAVRVQIATSALSALATHLAGLGAARKSILFVSEGFARHPRQRGEDSLPSLDTAIRTANRANVSISAFDPSEGPVEPARRDTLRALSEQTNGHAIFDVASAATSLTRAVGQATPYYLIAFRSGDIDADGKFHPVEVRVRRPNVKVAARKGYWAPSADDVLRAKLLARANEPKPPPAPPRRISPLIRPWFGVARGAAGTTQVRFVWEPTGRVPGDRSRSLALTRITLKASKPDGTAVYEGVVRPASAGAPFGTADDPVKVAFDAAPGRLRLQMEIEDASARVVDTDIRDFIVNPLNAPVALGTAEIIRARSARDYRALVADERAAPTSSREFSRSERLLIRVPAYAPAEGPVVAAWLVSKPGAAMRSLPVTEGPSPTIYQIDLPLAGLASGSYVVQLVAKSAAGEAKDELAFRVTP
jgi:VWFA-related protein